MKKMIILLSVIITFCLLLIGLAESEKAYEGECFSGESAVDIEKMAERSPENIQGSLIKITKEGFLNPTQIEKAINLLKKGRGEADGYLYNDDNRFWIDLRDVEMGYHRDNEEIIKNMFVNRINELMIQPDSHSFALNWETNEAFNRHWKIVEYSHFIGGIKVPGDFVRLVLNYDCKKEKVRVDRVMAFLRYKPFDFDEQVEGVYNRIMEIEQIAKRENKNIVSGPELLVKVFPYGLNVDSTKSASEGGVVKSGSGTTGEYELNIRWYTNGLKEDINPELE